MAEDHEGPTPQEYIVRNPEALKKGLREHVFGVRDWFLDRNPVTREAARAMDKVNKALPEGRLQQIHRFGIDMAKGPMTVAGMGVEALKMMPAVRLMMFLPEQAAALGAKVGGFFAEKTAESKPVQFAVGSVDRVVDQIFGRENLEEFAHTATHEPVTLEGARQVLVGMARPETGRQERRKMT